MKKGTTILLLALLAVVFLAVSCKNDPPPHVHTYDMTSWENDDANHWRKATCEHTEEVKDKAAHTWDEGEETIPAEPGKEGIKTYTCTVCGRKKTEKIDPLPPMTTSSIKFVDGYTLDKAYNNEPISIDKSNVVRVVDGVETQIDNPDAISFLFKEYDADTYIAEAPKKPGHYKVKVIVAASPEWTEKEFEQGFYIDKIKLKGDYDLKNSLAYKGESHLISELILTRADLPCILEGETVVIKDIKTNKNAGRIEVDSYKIVENEYYDDLDLPEFKLYATVNPFNISPATPINVTKVYDGTTNAEYKDWGYTIPEADRGKLTLTVTADGKDVGNHNPGGFNPIAFTLDGASTNNYTIDKSKISINITAKPLSFYTDPTAVYDGTNTEVVAGPEIIKGLVDGESLTITIKTGNPNVLAPTATPPSLTYTISAGTNTISSNYQIKQSEIDRARIIPVELVLKNPNSDALTKFEYQNNKKLTKKVNVLFDGIVNGQDITLEVEFSDVNVNSSYNGHKFLIGSGSTTYNYKLSETDYQQLKTAKISPKTLLFFGKYYMEKKGTVLLYFMLPSNIQDIGLIKVRLNVPEEHANWEYGDYYILSASSGWTLTPEPTNQNFTVKFWGDPTIYVRPIQPSSPTVTVGGSETTVTADAHGRLYCRIEGATVGEKYKITVKNGTETVSYDKMTLRSTGSSYIVQYIDPNNGIFEYNGENGRLLQLHAELIENQTYKVKVTKETKK